MTTTAPAARLAGMNNPFAGAEYAVKHGDMYLCERDDDGELVLHWSPVRHDPVQHSTVIRYTSFAQARLAADELPDGDVLYTVVIL